MIFSTWVGGAFVFACVLSISVRRSLRALLLRKIDFFVFVTGKFASKPGVLCAFGAGSLSAGIVKHMMIAKIVLATAMTVLTIAANRDIRTRRLPCGSKKIGSDSIKHS